MLFFNILLRFQKQDFIRLLINCNRNFFLKFSSLRLAFTKREMISVLILCGDSGISSIYFVFVFREEDQILSSPVIEDKYPYTRACNINFLCLSAKCTTYRR